MTATIFTVIGVAFVAYQFVYPILDFVDWGKKPWRKRR